MEEENITLEIKEKIEQVVEHSDWNKYLSISTALIAVFAAISSLLSGSYSNQAILEKNNAILYQNKASDQYAYYQAKGIKKTLAEVFFQQKSDPKIEKDIARYTKEQDQIKKQADAYVVKVEESDKKSEIVFEKHHKMALSVTFFQIAIALSAMSALLRRKSLWYLSISLAVIGIMFFIYGLI